MKQKVKEIKHCNMHNKKWHEKFDMLKQYVEEHNGKFPLQSEGKLGKWLYDQKRILNKGKLLAERKELLDSLGDWTIISTHQDKWNDKYKMLQEFINKNDRFPQPYEGVVGRWFYLQKKEFCKGTLSSERENLLNVLGDWTKNYEGPSRISKDEVMEKFKKYRETNDPDIRKELVIDNIGLVWKTLNKMRLKSVNPDLIQAGYLGLILAIDNYDINKAAFSTYACSYIEGHIKREMYFLSGVPTSYINLYTVIKEVEHEYNETIISNPNLANVIVERLITSGVISEKSYDETIRKVLLLRPLSLEEIMENEEESFYNMGYEVKDNDINDIYDDELSKILNERISKLNEQKQKILELYFGLNNNETHTYNEIGNILGVTHQAVANNFDRTLKKLSKKEKVKALSYYLHKEI